MTKTTDDQLRQALVMVEEARDYLARLPPVPATSEFLHKLSGFLDAHRGQDLPGYALPWSGTAYDPAGRPLLEAMLLDTTLTLREAQVEPSMRLQPAELQRRLAAGITMSLERPEWAFQGPT
ncbi:hypothetical protein HMPREF3069_05010 [Achromobacter xylosoxidans]|uniref:hypothetical protein n=1 Tax=Alcaligenes xylosoxydans xylosoxydans TaxID=85698 RepID=UPI0008A169C4|nr:hypothetical protein [Achromobacter xylosoxidans]OFS61654.1 hypothetical protein HMPREF3069_05010 [Achromobacter xylosoxidans]